MKRLILLFDIDGTLIHTAGAGGAAMGDVVTGEKDSTSWKDKVVFSGRTDRSLINEFFHLYNIENTPTNFANYRARFLEALEAYLPERNGTVLPAVTATLDRLAAEPQVGLALLTGNLRKAAHLKLAHYGLADYFYGEQDAAGGFGDNHPDRDDVARDALVEARERFGDVAAEQVWVIGDTPADVKCGRAIGANVLAVATGRFSIEELNATNPDLVVKDLEHADEWWSRLESEFGVSSNGANG